MAATSFYPVSLGPPEISATTSKYRSSVAFHSRKINFSIFATASPEKPEIELEFLGPKPGDAVNRAKAISGDKLLRNIMVDNKIEVYAIYGKLMNCGGGGSCGTCMVEILDGKDLLNERTNTELKYL